MELKMEDCLILYNTACCNRSKPGGSSRALLILLLGFVPHAILAAGLQVLHYKNTVSFPNVLPGSAIVVEKVFDPKTNRLRITSNSPYIQSAADLVKLEQEEGRLVWKKYGALANPRLRDKVEALKSGETMEVVISLKEPKGIVYLDKTKHTEEELRQQSMSLATLQPVISIPEFLAKYGIKSKAMYGANTFQVELTRTQLEKLAFDGDVASIDVWSPQIPMQSGYTDISTLARSAYNHNNNPVPITAGAGVNAATFETGIDPSVMNCWGGLDGSRIAQVSIPSSTVHSNETFRCLMNAAPGANLWHRNSKQYWLSLDINWIINNGIQSLSMSLERGDDSGRAVFPNYSAFFDYEFRIMDDFAYRWPYPVFSNGTANMGYQYDVNWQCYNAISVGNVRHTNQSHWELVDTTDPNGGCTQTKNPPARYGTIQDRELPMLVAPGFAPYPPQQLSDPCIETVTSSGRASCGTSLSSPIVNGIAADVLAADYRMTGWPEKVRVALLATAQNVDNRGYWSYLEDGRDGAGVVDGAGAVAFAQGHTMVYDWSPPAVTGIGAGSLSSADFDAQPPIDYKIQIPASKPSGMHLRVVLTWDSNPVVDTAANELSDLDLRVTDGTTGEGSWSWENNVEMVDIPNSEFAAGSVVDAFIYKDAYRIPSRARAQSFFYAIGWTWVKDHAD